MNRQHPAEKMSTAKPGTEAALGVIAKPDDPPKLLRAAKLVAAMRGGELPSRIPRYLELFH
jgi:hypothetical protein